MNKKVSLAVFALVTTCLCFSCDGTIRYVTVGDWVTSVDQNTYQTYMATLPTTYQFTYSIVQVEGSITDTKTLTFAKGTDWGMAKYQETETYQPDEYFEVVAKPYSMNTVYYYKTNQSSTLYSTATNKSEFDITDAKELLADQQLSLYILLTQYQRIYAAIGTLPSGSYPEGITGWRQLEGKDITDIDGKVYTCNVYEITFIDDSDNDYVTGMYYIDSTTNFCVMATYEEFTYNGTAPIETTTITLSSYLTGGDVIIPIV